MSWNSSIQFNNLYRAYLSLSVSAIVNPLTTTLNANNNSITNVNSITSITCATQTLTANTFNGSVLGGNSTSGSYYIGASSIPLLYLTNINNIAIGNNTLNAISSSTPQSNIAIGTDALRYGQPVASAGIGYQALSISNGQFCVGVGHQSGTNHTNGTGCTYLGVSSAASSSSVNNEMALGYQAVGKGANTIQLGNSSATTLYTPATVRSDTGTLTLNSQGGALNLQSAGTTYASVSSTGITSANFNGKLSIVGGTTSAGNVVLCNNGTNTTGNFDLLTDSNQHLTFSGGTGPGSNVLSVGGATNGSIVVPSTAGFITAPTVNATTVNHQAGALALQSGGTTCASLTTVDQTLGNTSSLYTTVFSSNLNNIQYPTAAYGSQSGSMGWNGNALGGEFSFINNFGNSGGALGGFTFNNRTGASSKQTLMRLTLDGISFFIDTAIRSTGRIDYYTGAGHTWYAVGIADYSAAIQYLVGGVVYPQFTVNHPSGTVSGTSFYEMRYNNVAIGSITQSGTTNILINGVSDHRLKSNVKPIDTSLLQKLKPCSFTWIQDNRDDIGFIAHEFAEVFPDSVINQKDEVDEAGKPKYQQMSNSVCIPLLVSCVQEQQQRISSLEAQLASLKAIVDSLVAGK